MKRALVFSAMMLVAAGGIAPAYAFNTKNNTKFPICVWSSTGNYFDKVGPGQTSRGWYYDKPITLHVAVLDLQVCPDEGSAQCQITCNDYVVSTCTVPPHMQQEILSVSKPSGDKAQWAAYLMDMPMSFNMNCH